MPKFTYNHYIIKKLRDGEDVNIAAADMDAVNYWEVAQSVRYISVPQVDGSLTLRTIW